MTLVVARIDTGRIAIAADTMLSERDMPIPVQQSVLKSICLPGGVCASFSGSPELSAKAFVEFRKSYPLGANYATTVAFFEASSAATNNDYIIAFANPAKLVTVRNGSRQRGVSRTHWIGDKTAYERFREYEHRCGRQYEQGRAVNAALFADEMAGSPASDLYSTMRNVVRNPDVPSVGGFVTVLSNRDIGFRFSVYSDTLLDWPMDLGKNGRLQLSDKFDLRASGENDGYSVSQISPGYYNMNAVAFYVLKGRLLVVFCQTKGGATACFTIKNVEPSRIAATLDKQVGFAFHAMCLVMSAREEYSSAIPRPKPDYGIGMSLYCEVNTMPRVQAP